MANKNQIFVYKICLLSVLIMSILYTDPDIETQQISTHFNTNFNNNNNFVRNYNITVEKSVPHKKLVKSGDKLRLDYYEKSCENVLRIISSTVVKIVNENDKAPAQLLRLMFHDCFIQGCDGSILLGKDTGNSSIPAERFAKPSETLKGFEYVDRIKDELEKVCPGTVSCSDILVIATRDALNLSGGPFFTVLMGRKDSMDSYHDLAITDIPKPVDDVNETLGVFIRRGFSPRDTVALLGSHNIGKMDCKFIKDRFSSDFKHTGKPDPTLSPSFFAELSAKCPNGSDAIIPSGSEFGPNYYQNLVQGRGLLHSDQDLMTNNETADVVRGYAADSSGKMFRNDFMRAMSKFVNLQDQNILQGEVRLICSLKNSITNNKNHHKDNNNKKKNTTDATRKSDATAMLKTNIWKSLVFVGLWVSIIKPTSAWI